MYSSLKMHLLGGDSSLDSLFSFLNSKSAVSTPSRDYSTVSGKIAANSKHKNHRRTKARVGPVLDVASPPLRSCLSERYEEPGVYFIRSYRHVFYLFSRPRLTLQSRLALHSRFSSLSLPRGWGLPYEPSCSAPVRMCLNKTFSCMCLSQK